MPKTPIAEHFIAAKAEFERHPDHRSAEAYIKATLAAASASIVAKAEYAATLRAVLKWLDLPERGDMTRNACKLLVRAYNQGGDYVRWDDIDLAHELAKKALRTT